MPNSLMDAEELKQWVLRRLGAPFIKVELTSDQLEDAVEQSRRWFSAKKGVKRVMPMQIYASEPEYVLDDQVDTVLDVAFPANPLDLSLIFSPYILQDEKVPYDVFSAPQSAGIYSSYEQTLQYVQMAKRILNAETDWRQEGRLLQLFPIPRDNGVILVEYKSHDFTIEQLSERDHDLIKRFTLAAAKRDVAQVRGKYSDFAGAQSATQLNAAVLMAESDREMEQLEKEISLSAFPMGFLLG